MFLGYPLIFNGSTDFAKAWSETLHKRYCRELWIHIINWIGIRNGIFSTIFVADGATNGFTSAFGGIFERVMCWAHMIRKVIYPFIKNIFLIKKL